MKKILNNSLYTFYPGSHTLDFSSFPNFQFNKLYAIINVTAGRVIYATGSHDAGLDGSFSYPTLYLAYDTGSMNNTDELQLIYHSNTENLADSQGAEILSTVDVNSGKNGLDINLLNSSFGGKLGQPLPAPYLDNAMSVGIMSGGSLKAPSMNYYDQLEVEVKTMPNTNVNVINTPQVDLYSFGGGNTVSASQPLPTGNYNPGTGSPTSYGSGAVDANTQRVAANMLINGVQVSTQAGATDAGTQRVVANINTIADINFSTSGQSTAGNNMITGTTSGTDVSGYRSFTCAITSTATGGTYIFEQSNDNTNWVALPVTNAALISGTAVNGAITATATTTVFSGPILTRYIRCRIATALTGGTASVNTKIAPFPFVPTSMIVSQATSSNLITQISGTVITSVTGATLSTATTTDIASAAITTTVTSANIALTNAQTISLQAIVSATSGTNQTLDITIQETYDNTNYYDVYHFPRITTVGQYQTPLLRMSGIGYRVVRTVSGTTPSFTMSLIRVSRQASSSYSKSFINRTIDPNTLNSTSSSYYTEGCDKLQLCASLSAGGTGTAAFKLQGSEDQVSWYDLGGSTSAIGPSSVTAVSYIGMLPKYVRAITSSVGTGLVLNQVCIKGNGE